MEKRRVGALVIVAGGVGLLVAQFLVESSSPWTWYGPRSVFGVFHLSLALNLILLELAAFHLVRFGLGKLVTIGLLAAGALLTWLPTRDWTRGYSGYELVGLWLLIASAVVVLIGVSWSYISERPTDYAPQWGFLVALRQGFLVPEAPTPERQSHETATTPEQDTDLRTGQADYRRPLIIGGSVLAAVLVALMPWFVGLTVSDEEDSLRGPVQDEEWRIALDGAGAGIHTISMIKTFSPLEEADVQDLGGRLVWEETETELCGVDIQSVGDGFLQIGGTFSTDDIFSTGECDTDTMRRAFDDFGVPATACVYVQSNGLEDEYCAPLAVD